MKSMTVMNVRKFLPVITMMASLCMVGCSSSETGDSAAPVKPAEKGAPTPAPGAPAANAVTPTNMNSAASNPNIPAGVRDQLKNYNK